MPDDKEKTPAVVLSQGGGDDDHQQTAAPSDSKERLHAAGPRPLLEALIDVADGADLDRTLENYARIPSSFYRLMGASHFQKPFLVKASTI